MLWRRAVGNGLEFEFLDPGTLQDGDLTLRLEATRPGDPVLGWTPTYRFSMRHSTTNRLMGEIALRAGWTPFVELYAGHLGYHVDPPYRGNGYAGRATKALLPLAAAHGLHPLWITCNPENLASKRTIESVGSVFVDQVALPPGNDMYESGDRAKLRYYVDLNASLDRDLAWTSCALDALMNLTPAIVDDLHAFEVRDLHALRLASPLALFRKLFEPNQRADAVEWLLRVEGASRAIDWRRLYVEARESLLATAQMD